MQNYILAFFALAAGIINLFWKEKGKWFVFAILLGVAGVSIWKEIAAGKAAEAQKEAEIKQDELRARLTGELLASYHKLDHLLFMVDLQQELMPDGEVTFEKAERYFPLPDVIGNSAVKSMRIHLVVNTDSTDIVLRKFQPDSIAVLVDGRMSYALSEDGIAEGGEGPHSFFREVIAPYFTYGIHFPANPPHLRMPLTLPVFLQSMNKERQVGFFEYEMASAVTGDQLNAFSSALKENLFISFKGYVTDNDSLGEEALSMMSVDGFRPNVFINMRTGEPVQSGDKVRIPIIVAQHPKLSFTEEVPL